MRATYEDEELERLSDQPLTRQDRELILSSTTLLGIFFALVLLCGLFFAFGYTLGRRTPYENPSAQAAITGEATPASFSTFSAKPKPSAASQPAPLVQGTEEAPAPEATNTEQISTDLHPVESQPAPKPTAAQPLLKLASTEKPAAAQLATTQVSPQPTLVQIAAIANPADADVLIRALRKRGYEASVRRDPTDALIHVQLGPFPNRSDALAMRQKLLSDGYNAMLK